MTKPNSPLQELIKTDLQTREFGFVWPDQDFIMNQIISECEEVKEAIETNEPSHRIQEEVGDLIHCVISLCLFHGFDVEETISKTEAKFSDRANCKIMGLSDIMQCFFFKKPKIHEA